MLTVESGEGLVVADINADGRLDLIVNQLVLLNAGQLAV